MTVGAVARAPAAAAVAALALAGLGMTCGPGGPPPAVETCEPPATPRDAGLADVDSLEIGYLGNDGAFVPFVDGGVARLSFGGQGSSMLVAHLRLRGADVPACLEQRTTMEEPGGAALATESAPLPTRPTADGARVTSSMYLVYDRASGVQVRLRATAAGRTAAALVWIDFDPATLVDAGVDAP
jgi:hypothetical protein